LFEVEATCNVPLLTCQVPLSGASACVVPSLKLAVRSTSRKPPGMLPACGSAGAPVWVCQAKSFCRTTPNSPSGSPWR
jgi:hypothetical protein